MAINIYINDGVELRVDDLSWDEMLKLFHKALSNKQSLRVVNGNGKVRAVNPHQILYFEEVETDEVGEAATTAHAERVSAH